jgi:hypothetical protein
VSHGENALIRLLAQILEVADLFQIFADTCSTITVTYVA